MNSYVAKRVGKLGFKIVPEKVLVRDKKSKQIQESIKVSL